MECGLGCHVIRLGTCYLNVGVFMTVNLIQANTTIPITVFSDRMKLKCSQWYLTPCRLQFSVMLGRCHA